MHRSRLNLAWSAWVVPVALALTVWVAHGLVLTAGSAIQKQRADIGKQVAKAVSCIAKAAMKCEKSGVTSGSECDLANPPASTVPDPDAKQKFIDALQTCASKIDFSKKSATGDPSADYTGIGCTGDSDPNTAGDQPYADLNAFQASVAPGTEKQLAMIPPFIDAICGGLNSMDPMIIACVATDAKVLLKYGTAVAKCESQCENDYVGTKGNGGLTDSTTQCSLVSASAATPFKLCEQAARDKADAAAINSAGLDLIVDGVGMTPGLNAALDGANNDLYNENDCP